MRPSPLASSSPAAGRLLIGTSGFNYPHWRGLFYPPDLPPSQWLAFYARHFGAVELNVTFYRLPGESAFCRWAEVVPEGFRFVVKGSRYITHIRRLRECAEAVELLLKRAAPLHSRLEAVLWQLPPRFAADLKRLEAFLGVLRDVGEALGLRALRHAFEFRDDSWLKPPVGELLALYGAAAVMADWPFGTRWLETATPWVYLRRHGPAPPYAGSYPDAVLAEDARRIRRWLAGERDVLCFFNNDVAGHALTDARRLRAMVMAPEGSG